MSGGGGGSSKPKTETKKNEPVPGSSPLMTQPPFMPGMDQMLAQQLSAGGYGNIADLLAYGSQIFTPMQVLDTRPKPAPATPTTPTPTPTPTTPRPGHSTGDRPQRRPGYYNVNRR